MSSFMLVLPHSSFLSLSMDETIGDEPVEPVSDIHIRNKEHEVSLEPGSSSILLSNEMVTPSTNYYPESARKLSTDILDAKDLDRIDSSEHADVSPRRVNGAGVTVKEFILKNYDGEKLIVVGTSILKEEHKPGNTKRSICIIWPEDPKLEICMDKLGTKKKFKQRQVPGRMKMTVSFLGYYIKINQYQTPIIMIMDNLPSNDDKVDSVDMLNSQGGIRTKILSKFGFSEYFIKSTLGGKGVIHKAGACRGSIMQSWIQDCLKPGTAGSKNSIAALSSAIQPVSHISHGISESSSGLSSNDIGDGISLKEWLEAGQNKENKVFRQVLDLVDFWHYLGVSLQELRPSCFKLLGSYEIMYLGSFVCANGSANTEDQLVHQPHHNRMIRDLYIKTCILGTARLGRSRK